MPTDPHTSATLPLELHMADGHAILQVHHVVRGPWHIAELALRVPELTFPFDVSGGAERFRNHRCHLQRLDFSLPLAAINAHLATVDWATAGLRGVGDVCLSVADAAGGANGGLALVAAYGVDGRQATFTCRLYFQAVGPQDVRCVFYNGRTFGAWPLPGPLLSMALCQALQQVPWTLCAPDVAVVQPAQAFCGEVLPRAGWRIADVSQSCLVRLAAGADGLQATLMACDPTAAAAALRAAVVPPDAAAQVVLDGLAGHGAAEAALAQGDLDAAYAAYRQAALQAPADAFVTDRLLALGTVRADWHAHTASLARQALSAAPIAARLALASLALQRQEHGNAAAHYTALATAADNLLTTQERQAARHAAAHLSAAPTPAAACALTTVASSTASAVASATDAAAALGAAARWAGRLAAVAARGAWSEAHALIRRAAAELPTESVFSLCLQLAGIAQAQGDAFVVSRALEDARACLTGGPPPARAAEQVQQYLERAEYPHGPASLLALLADVGLDAALARALAASLTATPAVGDGRFERLINTLAEQPHTVPEAIVWCRRMAESFPAEDKPFVHLVALLIAAPEQGSPTPVFAEWAAQRHGRDRAIILEAFCAHLLSQNNRAGAMAMLWDACAADTGSTDNVPRLQALAHYHGATGNWPLLMPVLRLQVQLLPPGAEQDAIWRRMADVACEHLDALDDAVAYLDRLAVPTVSDGLWQAGLLAAAEAWETLADRDDLMPTLPGGMRLRVAAALAATGDRRRLSAGIRPLLTDPRWGMAAWAVAEAALRDAAGVAQLQAWRHEALAQAELGPHLRPYVQLQCAAAQAAASQAPVDLAALEPALQAVCWSDVATAEAVLALTEGLAGGALWHLRAARALVDRLPAQDTRRVAPLRTELQHALVNGDARRAVAVARQILGLEDYGQALWLIETLRRWAPAEEIRQLVQEYTNGVADAPWHTALTCILGDLRLQAHDYAGAATVLDAVPPRLRLYPWGLLAHALGLATDVLSRKLQGALCCLAAAPSPADRDHWQRQVAQLQLQSGDAAAAAATMAAICRAAPEDDAAFGNWLAAVAQAGDAGALAAGVAQRLQSQATAAERRATVLAAAPVWATLPGQQQAIAAALMAHCTSAIALDPECYQRLRDTFLLAKDALGLAACLGGLAARPGTDVAVQRALYNDAAAHAEAGGDAAAAYTFRLAAVRAGDTSPQTLAPCLHYARAHHAWPEDAHLLGLLLQGLEAHAPPQHDVQAERVAVWRDRADVPHQRAALAARLAGAPNAGDVHAQAATLAAAAADAAGAAAHWQAALACPDPQIAWWRYAQQQCVDAEDAAGRLALARLAVDHLKTLEAQVASAPATEQAHWLALVAHARSLAADKTPSLQAYKTLVLLVPPWQALACYLADALPVFVAAAAWQPLTDLYAIVLQQAPDAGAQAEVLCASGVLRRDHLSDIDGAIADFKQAQARDPGCVLAHEQLGLSYSKQQQWTPSIAVLEVCLQRGGAQTSRAAIAALLTAYEATAAYAPALRLCGMLMARAVEDGVDGAAGLDLRERRSRCLVALGRAKEAEMQWRDYLGSLSDAAEPDLRTGALCALGDLALARGDNEAARARFEHATQLDIDCEPARLGRIRAYTALQEYNRVVALRLREAEVAQSPQARAEHLLAAAKLLEEHLDDRDEATWLLEQACEATPRDPGLLQQLMDRYTAAGEDAKKLLTAERLLALFPDAHFDADFFMSMAQDYLPVDAIRASRLAMRALALEPQNRERQAFCRQVQAAAGDWRGLAALEQATVPNLADPSERAQRAAALGAVYIDRLDDLGRGILALQMACDANPDESEYTRQLAAACARDPRTYPQATSLYQGLLRRAPFSLGILRILARLAGQQNALDRCYGYYACLLCLAPEDAEAQAFVMACRRGRRATPGGLTDARVQPLVRAKVPDSVRGLLLEVGQAWMDAVPSSALATAPHVMVQVIRRDVQECLQALMQKTPGANATANDATFPDNAAARDLFVFAQSEDYFDLRAAMGVAFAAPPAHRA